MARRSTTSSREPSQPGTAATSAIAKFCRTLPGTTEDIKWEDHLVFSVGRKMYACMSVADSNGVSFKCDEEDNLRLTQIDGIIPTPYAARFGWVSVTRKGILKPAEIKALVRKSHQLVASCLPKKTRRQLGLDG